VIGLIALAAIVLPMITRMPRATDEGLTTGTVTGGDAVATP
jgi:hypothetical protein